MRHTVGFTALAAGALALAHAALAQPAPTRPASVRLTQAQWACLQTRLGNLQRAASDIVRVPLSPCGQGSGTRGPWASNVSVGNNAPRSAPPLPPADTTHAPLYLSKADLACIERHLPELTASAQVSQIDLAQCTKH